MLYIGKISQILEIFCKPIYKPIFKHDLNQDFTDKNYDVARIPASQTDQYAFYKGNSEIFVTNISKNGSGDITGITKSDAITLSVDYTVADLIDSDGDSVADALDVYMYITYDEDLVDNFGMAGISNNGSAVGQVYDMANDIKKMTINFTGN